MSKKTVRCEQCGKYFRMHYLKLRKKKNGGQVIRCSTCQHNKEPDDQLKFRNINSKKNRDKFHSTPPLVTNKKKRKKTKQVGMGLMVGSGDSSEYLDAKNLKPDWTKKCSQCGATPVVPLINMCGPCTFGEADTVDGNW